MYSFLIIGATDLVLVAGIAIYTISTRRPKYFRGQLKPLEEVLGEYISGQRRANKMPPVFTLARKKMANSRSG